MRKRINLQLLKQLKQRTINSDSIYMRTLLEQSALLINNTYLDVTRPFCNICLHTSRPQNYIQTIFSKHKNYFKTKQLQPFNISIANQFNGKQKVQMLRNKYEYIDDLVTFGEEGCVEDGRWIGGENKYDLILSDLQLHLSQNAEGLLKGYLRSLTGDGALIGCCLGEATLKELYWSYIMAENERSGGISPKIANLPSMGYLGSMLTGAHYQLCTMIDQEINLQFQSPIDLISVIQELGESGYLHGKRKGVFKDVLLAMTAMYHVQFAKDKTGQQQSQINYNTENKDQNRNVEATLQLLSFIGWKYADSQPKALKRGQQYVESKDFIDELKEMDSDLKHYVFRQDQDEPEQLK